MVVNGLLLPATLVYLLQQGRWKRPATVDRLAALTGVQRPEEFIFLDHAGMIRETTASRAIVDRSQGALYGLIATPHGDGLSFACDVLDVCHAVVLAMTWDEDFLCLDYRSHLDQPTVVVSRWSDEKSPPKWICIAPTFDSFAQQLNL